MRWRHSYYPKMSKWQLRMQCLQELLVIEDTVSGQYRDGAPSLSPPPPLIALPLIASSLVNCFPLLCVVMVMLTGVCGQCSLSSLSGGVPCSWSR